MMVGGILQLISPRAIARVGFLQELDHHQCGIAGIEPHTVGDCCLGGSLSPAALILIASLYWAGGLAAGPAWNTWIGSPGPRRSASRFFLSELRSANF